jgi:hypothetical protein
MNSGTGEEKRAGRLLSNMLEVIPIAPGASLGVSGTGVTAWGVEAGGMVSGTISLPGSGRANAQRQECTPPQSVERSTGG